MPFAGVGGTSVRDSQYLIDNSLRFNDGDSPQLSRSTGTTNKRTFTVSVWVKRTTNGARQVIWSSDKQTNDTGDGSKGGSGIGLQFWNDDKFYLGGFGGNFQIRSNGLQRDNSAWYHIVAGIDTTQSDQNNRAKLYINGENVSSLTAMVGQNTDVKFATNRIGVKSETANYSDADSLGSYLDGYVTELHVIDGQQLSPTDFGEFSEEGIWKPIEYSGSYGSDGYYLDFENSGSLGADQSGNGNNFTPTNLASTDQTTDTPTNNFATLNSLHRYTDRFSEGNLKLNGVEKTGTPVELQTSTLGATSGKWYWEVKFEWTGSLTSTSARMGIGTELSVPPNPNSSSDEGSAVQIAANKGATLSFRNLNSSPTTNTTGFNTLDPDDIFMFALDIDNKKLFIGKNGTWYNSADPVAGTNAQAYSWTFSNGDITFPVIAFYSGDTASNTYNHTLLPNFGNPAFSISSGNSDGNGYGNFEYAPPSGYLALCTQNLATALSPTIDDGSEYFNSILYTGDGNNGRTVTGLGFQPDWTWIKSRNRSDVDHILNDSTRGAGKNIYTNATYPEDTSTNKIVSFDSDGLTLNNHVSVNGSTDTYVAWNWKANAGTTSSNTDGSITSTVQTGGAGFSVVTFTGNGSNDATIGHGLGTTPAMIITKNRDDSINWRVWHKDLTSNYVLFLASTLAEIAPTGQSNGYIKTVNSSTYSVYQGNVDTNGVNGSGDDMIAYCFAEIEGYSKFGSYTANGSTDGTFVYTGFRPAFVIIKKSSDSGIWFLYDIKRDPYNVVVHRLVANDTQAENTGSGDDIDIVSNGIKIRSSASAINASGQTFIYMCFAENPFVSSTGIPVVAR